jgi:hypothetical protein
MINNKIRFLIVFCATYLLNCNELDKAQLSISDKIKYRNELFTGKFRDGTDDSSYRIITCTDGLIDKIEYYTFSNCDEIEIINPIFQNLKDSVSVFGYFTESDSSYEKILVVSKNRKIIANLKSFLFQNVVDNLNTKMDSSIVIWTYDKIYLNSDLDKTLVIYELKLTDSILVKKL